MEKIDRTTQERFFEVVELKTPVRIHLFSKKILTGFIAKEDRFGIAFIEQTPKGAREVYIFKGDIGYIEPLQRVKLPPIEKFKKGKTT